MQQQRGKGGNWACAGRCGKMGKAGHAVTVFPGAGATLASAGIPLPRVCDVPCHPPACACPLHASAPHPASSATQAQQPTGITCEQPPYDAICVSLECGSFVPSCDCCFLNPTILRAMHVNPSSCHGAQHHQPNRCTAAAQQSHADDSTAPPPPTPQRCIMETSVPTLVPAMPRSQPCTT